MIEPDSSSLPGRREVPYTVQYGLQVLLCHVITLCYWYSVLKTSEDLDYFGPLHSKREERDTSVSSVSTEFGTRQRRKQRKQK